MAIEEKAFLTGSHAYGTPGPDSDVDLVVLMAPSEAADLARIMSAEIERSGAACYPGLQFKAGRLNLIVETSPKSFDNWRRGTDQLVERAPVTRDEAVELLKRLESGAVQ